MVTHSQIMIDLAGTQPTADELRLLKQYEVGGICLFRRNLRDRYQLTELIQQLRELCGEQLIVAIDQEGGNVVRFTEIPHSIGHMALGSADDLAMTKAMAAMNARALKRLGITVNFAPVADVSNNPSNPVIGDRAFSHSASKAASHVAAFVEGTQSAGIAATLKHFPGHGDTATDSHHALPSLEVDLTRLENVELVPFKAGIAASAACIMSFHGIVKALDPENPATFSPTILKDLLRKQLGFTGVIFSDALEMQAIAASHSPEASVIRALEAGVDMPLYDVHGGSVKTHETIFRAVDRAAHEGQLDSLETSASQQRLKTLSQQFPALYEPEQGWQHEDYQLQKMATDKAVCSLGKLGALSKEEPVTLIASDADVGGSASDWATNPAFALAQRLREKGFKVSEVYYQPKTLSIGHVLSRLGPINLFVSSSRTRLHADEVELAHQLARASERFIHVALWNPYSALDLPLPAVMSFGFHGAALDRVVAILQGAPARGTAPFEPSLLDAHGKR